MKKAKSILKQTNPRPNLSIWKQRWKRVDMLLTALILPGFPQVMKKPQLPECLLFMFGTGALITLLIGFILSGDGKQTLDYVYATLYAFDFSNIYPLYLRESVAAFGDILPIHPSGEPLIVQPFFWELVGTHITVYVVCAALSVWRQWKSTRKDLEKDT